MKKLVYVSKPSIHQMKPTKVDYVVQAGPYPNRIKFEWVHIGRREANVQEGNGSKWCQEQERSGADGAGEDMGKGKRTVNSSLAELRIAYNSQITISGPKGRLEEVCC